MIASLHLTSTCSDVICSDADVDVGCSLKAAQHDSHTTDGVSAAASGGALSGNSGSQPMVLSNNTAMTGGAVHCDSCQQLTMTTGSVIEYSHAARGGGACCLTCECILFQDVHFLSNRWAYSHHCSVCIRTASAPAVSHDVYVHPRHVV